MFLYRWLRKIIEYLTGYPADDELAKEFMWAWRLTGFRPSEIELNLDDDWISFTFRKGLIAYHCWMEIIGDKFHISTLDFNIFKNKRKFRKTAYLIDKYLSIPIKGASKEEIVTFCARATNINKLYPNEEPSEYLEFESYHHAFRL